MLNPTFQIVSPLTLINMVEKGSGLALVYPVGKEVEAGGRYGSSDHAGDGVRT